MGKKINDMTKEELKVEVGASDAAAVKKQAAKDRLYEEERK